MLNYGFNVTTHGENLIAACMDLGAPLKITRAAVGSGLAGGSLADTHALIHYVADASIGERRHEGNLLFLSVQYHNDDHPEVGDFVLSEFIVYAQNPETGRETDFLYATLGDNRQPVPAFRSGFPASVWTFPVVLTVSRDLQVIISASPGIVTFIDLQAAIDELTRSIMTGTVTLPLAATNGEDLLTSSGTPIHARYTIESGMVMSAVKGQITAAKQEAIIAAGIAADAKIAAHNTAAVSHPAHLAIVTK